MSAPRPVVRYSRVDPAQQSERSFQTQVVALFKAQGWIAYHTHDSRRSEPGFPDLVLVHVNRGIVFAELKREKGKVSEAQQRWIDYLTEAGGRVFVWRPSSWQQCVDTAAGK